MTSVWILQECDLWKYPIIGVLSSPNEAKIEEALKEWFFEDYPSRHPNRRLRWLGLKFCDEDGMIGFEYCLVDRNGKEGPKHPSVWKYWLDEMELL